MNSRDPDSTSRLPDPASFLSGDAGDVTDPWRRAKRTAGELAYNAIDTVTGTRLRAARLGGRGGGGGRPASRRGGVRRADPGALRGTRAARLRP